MPGAVAWLSMFFPASDCCPTELMALLRLAPPIAPPAMMAAIAANGASAADAKPAVAPNAAFNPITAVATVAIPVMPCHATNATTTAWIAPGCSFRNARMFPRTPTRPRAASAAEVKKPRICSLLALIHAPSSFSLVVIVLMDSFMPCAGSPDWPPNSAVRKLAPTLATAVCMFMIAPCKVLPKPCAIPAALSLMLCWSIAIVISPLASRASKSWPLAVTDALIHDVAGNRVSSRANDSPVTLPLLTMSWNTSPISAMLVPPIAAASATVVM